MVLEVPTLSTTTTMPLVATKGEGGENSQGKIFKERIIWTYVIVFLHDSSAASTISVMEHGGTSSGTVWWYSMTHLHNTLCEFV